MKCRSSWVLLHFHLKALESNKISNEPYYSSTTNHWWNEFSLFCTLCRLCIHEKTWKHCFFAPTGIICIWTMNFFSAPTVKPPIKSVRRIHYAQGRKHKKKEEKKNSLAHELFCVSFSVEFRSSYRKVLIFVADFGSTLFPFVFHFIHFVIATRAITSVANYSTVGTYCF